MFDFNDEEYDLNSNSPLGQLHDRSYISYTNIDNKSIRIEQTYNANAKSWCIATIDGEILLAVNGKEPIYFNLLMSRDTNIYDNVIDMNVVDTIIDD